MRGRQVFLLVLLGAVCWCAAASAEGPKQSFSVTLMWQGQSNGASNWQLDVENASRTKFINTVDWTPPPGLTVNSITSSQGGKCRLDGGHIKCAGNLTPESCTTCNGQSMLINFRGTGFESTYVKTETGGYWVSMGWFTGTTDVTVSTPFADLPLCKKGQVSTKAKPCAKR